MRSCPSTLTPSHTHTVCVPCCAQDRLAQILVDAELQALAQQILAQVGTKGDKKGDKAKAAAAAAGGSSKHLLGPAWRGCQHSLLHAPAIHSCGRHVTSCSILCYSKAAQLMHAARHTNTALRSACVREWALTALVLLVLLQGSGSSWRRQQQQHLPQQVAARSSARRPELLLLLWSQRLLVQQHARLAGVHSSPQQQQQERLR